MRRYGTRRWRAARLKNATERCDRLRVTFTFSSRRTSLSGDGKKSSAILTRPISPLLYLTVGFFINRLSFPPIAGSENPYLLVSPCEAHRHNGAPDPSETVVPLLAATMTRSSAITRSGSKNACWASSNPMPCLARLSLSFAVSHSKSDIGWNHDLY